MASAFLPLMVMACATVHSVHGAASHANPIRKVITLMQDMQKEIEVEGEKEKELFDKFMCYCSSSGGDLDKSLADTKKEAEELAMKLKASKAEKQQVEQEIAGHKADREGAQHDLAEATSVREKEAKEYAAASSELKSNGAAVTSAIKALESATGGASLIQLPAVQQLRRLLPRLHASGDSYDHRHLAAFLEQRGDYQPASGQIVGMLKAMKDEMEADLAEATKDEETAKGTYESLNSAKTAEVDVASSAVETKTKRNGDLAVTIVETQDAVEDAETEAVETEKFIGNLKEQCATKQQEWDEREKMRADEVAAIGEAIAVLSDDDALDTFKKAVPAASLLDTDPVDPLSFIQQSSRLRTSVGARVTLRTSMRLRRVDMLLKHIADRRSGTALALISLRLRTKIREGFRAGSGGFEAVVAVVDEMVQNLSKEQAADDKQKAWCDSELEKAAQEEKSGNEKKAGLEASADEISDGVKSIEDEIAILQEGIASTDKAATESTEERKKDHEDYVELITQTRAATMLLGKAKNKLNKFYNPTLVTAEPEEKEGFTQLHHHSHRHRHHHHRHADEMAFLAQVRVRRSRADVAPPPAPETFGAYEKNSKSTGIIALMDSIIRDLEKDQAEAEFNEKKAQEDYVEMMNTCATQRAEAAESIVGKQKAKAENEAKLVDVKDSMSLQKEELMQTKLYMANVHGQCDALMKDYDKRANARAEDIDGLKNAKSTLNAGGDF